MTDEKKCVSKDVCGVSKKKGITVSKCDNKCEWGRRKE